MTALTSPDTKPKDLNALRDRLDEEYKKAHSQLFDYQRGFSAGFDAAVSALNDSHRYRAALTEIESLRTKLESAQEGERFYRREWESACERLEYAASERDEFKAQCEASAKAITLFQEERDAWRAQCEKLAAAGERLIGPYNLDNIRAVHPTHPLMQMQDALIDYNKFKESK